MAPYYVGYKEHPAMFLLCALLLVAVVATPAAWMRMVLMFVLFPVCVAIAARDLKAYLDDALKEAYMAGYQDAGGGREAAPGRLTD
ncbi:MAG: hypothetical protein R3174_12070 [Gammaproteobacteria bacterium]|nr:hypothetical protein [Gammaproteobacteria bacterium]